MAEPDDDDLQIAYLALPRGVPVHAADGAEIGKVHRVLENAREHLFDGIVVDTGEGRRFVDAPEVARITRKRVTLTIDAAEAAELPPHQGAIKRRMERAGKRWRRWLPGR